ncbi:MAG: sulfatase-like hydrolase/transferase [Limisphaerales bacterium]
MIRGGLFWNGWRRALVARGAGGHAVAVLAVLVVLLVDLPMGAADAPSPASGKASKSAYPGNVHRRSPLPNVVLLAADGWADSDLGTNGAFPNLEKLAASGMRWTQAYAGAASTPASRAALLTGRHSGHGRIRGPVPGPLANEDVTLGEVLRAAGYRTAAIGVWDLGGNNTSGHPLRQGFSDWFGFLDSKEAQDLYPKALWRNAETFDNLIDQRGRLANYAPDWFARFATNYIQVHEDHPFFLYVAHPLPGNLSSEDMRGRHSLLWDRFVGAVVRELGQSRVRRETLLVVTSTGGGAPSDDRLAESRLRVPLLVSWPGTIPAGQTQDRPVALWDVLPTIGALAKVPIPQGLDGVSLAPEMLGGQKEPVTRAGGLYWETADASPNRAIRWEHWKAVERSMGSNVELYDLKVDPAAARNIAADQPERLAEARRRLREAADPLTSSGP